MEDGLTAVLRRGTGADLQRRVHRETGDLTAVVRAAVEVTAGRAASAPSRDPRCPCDGWSDYGEVAPRNRARV